MQDYTGKAYAYIAIGLIVFSAVSFGLVFTALGIYSLIAAILFSLAALSFCSVQKRKNNFKWLIVIKVATYFTLTLYIGFFIGGIIWSVL